MDPGGGGGEAVAKRSRRSAVFGDPGVGEVRVGEVGEVDGRTAERTTGGEGGGGGGGGEGGDGGREGSGDGGGEGGGEVEAATVEMAVERTAAVERVRVGEVGEVDGRTAERTTGGEGGGGGGGGEGSGDGGGEGGGEVEAATVEMAVERTAAVERVSEEAAVEKEAARRVWIERERGEAAVERVASPVTGTNRGAVTGEVTGGLTCDGPTDRARHR
uniref:OSJNBa0011J08.27 protein n=1 Tax=Oryza sativa subsp. japonica TaxID=39947 RepID=Q7FAV0_ORYSJ|nr:OSJNBa0011J08.27 [Oryza sativa Japonica Group]